MPPAALVERDRVRALRALAVLDQPDDERFDKITRLAQQLFDVPMVSLTLIDATRQWRASWSGPLDREAALDGAICAVAMRSEGAFVRSDLSADPAFADNPFVVGEPRLRFYAGTPLHAPGGEPIGTLCVMDTEPRSITSRQLAALANLGQWAERELSRATEQRQVAQIQRRLLPQQGPTVSGYAWAGLCAPARGVVASDFYDWYSSAGAVQVTLARVLGSGLGAALVAATARATLRGAAITSDPAEHIDVTGRLLRSDFDELDVDLELFVGRLDATTGRFHFVEAGAWSILLARADGTSSWVHLTRPALLATDAPFTTRSLQLEPGDTLVCASANVRREEADGGVEARLAAFVSSATMADIEDQITEIELTRQGVEALTAVVVRRVLR